ncbi:helix-turn-helix domain-containing protein [Nocardia sp. NPDC051052]|uniref:helix-turn-helix domain-containing protein n=1 Tax=Nocardia sp. NPDC051052 TaxID=3364322 RepID=UPI0037A8C32A
MQEDDWTRLGRYVRTRRKAVGFATARALAAEMEVHERTIGNIERGARDSYNASTLTALEGALGWSPGDTGRILDGGEPTVRTAETSNPLGVNQPLEPKDLRLESAQVFEFLRVTEHFSGVLTSNAGNPIDWNDVKSIYDELVAAVTDLSREYITRMVELNGRPGGPLSPLVEFAIRNYLDESPYIGTPDDRELIERKYRRWLAGRNVELTPAEELMFGERWRRSAG